METPRYETGERQGYKPAIRTPYIAASSRSRYAQQLVRALGGFKEMEAIDGPTGIAILRAVNPQLANLVGSVFESSSDARKAELSFARARYPFSDYIIRAGQALAPAGKDFPSDWLVTDQFPFGIIVKNAVEVVEGVIGSTSVVGMPQAVLGVGDFIGLFELLDKLKDAPGPPKPDWTIYSGAHSFRFIEYPTQEGKWKKLRAKYPQSLGPYDRDEAPLLEELYYLKRIRPLLEQCREWESEILYFSPGWVALLGNGSIGELLGANQDAALGLVRCLTDTAWLAAATVRQSSNITEKMLESWGGSRDVTKCNAAYVLITLCREVLAGRRPCFVPVDERPDFAPFETIQREFLRVADLRETILAPSYLGHGQTGYIPLHLYVPDAFRQSPRDGLIDVLRIIARTKRKVRDWPEAERAAVPALNVEDIFSRAQFRVRTGQARKTGKHGGVATFSVDFSDADRTGEHQEYAIELTDFYDDPFDSDDTIPASDCKFFRVCVKLQR
jgi:hypothetical protein